MHNAPPESEGVKAERQRLTEQATISEGRLKQGEVVIARADQLLERLTKLRSELMLQTLMHRDASPLSRDVWIKLGPELTNSATCSQVSSTPSRICGSWPTPRPVRLLAQPWALVWSDGSFTSRGSDARSRLAATAARNSSELVIGPASAAAATGADGCGAEPPRVIAAPAPSEQISIVAMIDARRRRRRSRSSTVIVSRRTGRESPRRLVTVAEIGRMPFLHRQRVRRS